jgi:hypothetical protein
MRMMMNKTTGLLVPAPRGRRGTRRRWILQQLQPRQQVSTGDAIFLRGELFSKG